MITSHICFQNLIDSDICMNEENHLRLDLQRLYVIVLSLTSAFAVLLISNFPEKNLSQTRNTAENRT